MTDPVNRFRLSNTASTPPGAIPKGPTAHDRLIRVTVVLKAPPLPDDHPAAKRYQAAAASAPQHRPALTHQELRQIHRPDDAHVELVKRFAEDHGLTVVRVSRIRHDVELEGPASSINAAFGIKLEDFEHHGVTCHAHQDDIHLPESLRGIVIGVLGLDDVPFSRSFARTEFGTAAPYTSAQLTEHYHFPAAAGRGQRIAILCFGGGYHESDIDTFFSDLKKKPPALTNISVLGTKCDPLPADRLKEMTLYLKKGGNPRKAQCAGFTLLDVKRYKATLEVTMDIQLAGSVASGAAIDLYFAPNTPRGYYNAVYAALGGQDHDGEESAGKAASERVLPTVISISWGESEIIGSENTYKLLELAFEKAALMHVPVCCASGDSGSIDLTRPDVASVVYPASSRYTLACGGTGFTRNQKTQEVEETSWNSVSQFGHQATGGGVSGFVERPDHQKSAGVPSHADLNGKAWLSKEVDKARFHGRGVPDVAAYADVVGGYQMFIGGQTFQMGGTSAAAPMWAGLIARLSEKLGRPIGWLNELIYQDEFTPAFKSITLGNNKINENGAAYFAAGPGWNGCCGLGVPHGKKLLECLRKTFAADRAASGKPAGSAKVIAKLTR